MSATDCGLAETLIAARSVRALGADSEPMLAAHLARCTACLRVARELEVEVDSPAGPEAACAEELGVIAPDTYVRGVEIGRGGMGHITRAYDRRLGRVVAIKLLLDPRLAARFEREARLTARLQHPAIVTVYEAGRWPSGEPFYAMKYVAGQPLDAVIAGLDTLDARLELLANLTAVVEAIAYAHSERIVHRDLKPGNILVGPFGETVVICVNEAAHAAATVARAAGRRADARAAAEAAVRAAAALARAELVLADIEADAGERGAAAGRLLRMLARLEAATARWPHVLELQERLAFSAVRLGELEANAAQARPLGARALAILQPLVQRRGLELEFRGLPERARRVTNAGAPVPPRARQGE